MENKNPAAKARLLVARMSVEPATARILGEMSERLPIAFAQSVNTAYLAAQLSGVMDCGIPPEDLVRAALLHDAGELKLDPAVLNKPGKLTAGELAAVRTHPELGAAMLREGGYSDRVIEAVLTHHERLDGSGYPTGIRNIGMPSKVLAVCDVYEALTTSRPQRKAFTVYEATAMMSEMPLSKVVLMSVKACSDT